MQPSNEQGFALIEAIVSAAVLALLAVAILAGIDGATNSAGREKTRAIAASLAEEDQERMRSMQVEELAGYTDEQPVDVDGVQYTVKSESRWVRDDTGATPSCTNNERESDYLRISTTVTPPGSRSAAPVEITSLVAPSVAYSSTRGSLAVKVVSRDDLPIENLAVNISGASSHQKLTNEDGCALFEYIPVGNYVAQLTTPGWVDEWGNEVAQADAVVTSGNLNVETIAYDRAARVDVAFTTTKPGTAEELASTGTSVSATNSDEPGLRRVFTSLPTADKLFPFQTAYSFYAGRCRESDPTIYAPNYFQVDPGLAAAPSLDPDGYETISVRQPPLSLRVRDNNSNYVAEGTSARVRARLRTPVEDGVQCQEPVIVMYVRNNPYRSGTEAIGWASRTAAPAPFDSGMPFGVYDICVQVGSRHRRTSSDAPYYNTAPNGLANVSTNGNAALRLTASSDGSCPW